MRRLSPPHRSIAALVAFGFLSVAAPAVAVTKADFDSAYAAASAAEAEAGKSHNQWTSTQDALDAARKAAAAGDYDEGRRKAVLAGEMARRSIEQATQQKDAWRAAVIGADEPAPPAKAVK